MTKPDGNGQSAFMPKNRMVLFVCLFVRLFLFNLFHSLKPVFFFSEGNYVYDTYVKKPNGDDVLQFLNLLSFFNFDMFSI